MKMPFLSIQKCTRSEIKIVKK